MHGEAWQTLLMGFICPLAIDFMRALGCKSVRRLTQVVGGCTIGRQGKWGGLSATLVVVGSIQSPHSSALMTYDGNDEQNKLLDQSPGELCRRDNWSSLQSVLSENAVIAKHGLAKGRKMSAVDIFSTVINVQTMVQQCNLQIR